MPPALQSVLNDIQQNNYASLAILAAVGYDYVLIFSKEIEYIWSKPWTWVSVSFVLVRYVGLWDLLLFFLGEIIFTMYLWTFVVYLGAADFVMILRVWAMYNRSRLILCTLLTTFALEMISTIALTGNPKYVSESTIRIDNFSLCVLKAARPTWTNMVAIFQLIHNAVTCMLAIVQFVRQSIQMYRVTKRWQLNRYINLLVRQGIFYFIAVLVFNLITVLAAWKKLPTTGWPVIPLYLLGNVPMYALTPRFIISIRELYAHDLQGRAVGGIDSGFGLSSGRGAAGTAIVFADGEQSNSEGLEDIEEVPREIVATTKAE